MFSDVIKRALEREVAGQPRAINTVVRGATRVVSGLTPRERSFCAYLLMGPPGTGKTHLVSAMARLLRGSDRDLVTVTCAPIAGLDSWVAMASQMAMVATSREIARPAEPSGPVPPAIICIDYLERTTKEVSRSLATALESGRISLQDGRRADLRDVLIFITSGLCSRQILDESAGIGFAGALDEEDDAPDDRLQETCQAQAEECFGRDLMAQLDALVIFRRLDAETLPQVLERRLERLNGWLSRNGVACELDDAAKRFLIDRGARDLRGGARDLVRAHQKFLEFPLADLLVSRRVLPGGRICIDRKDGEDHLHFSVRTPEGPPLVSPLGRAVHRIAVK